MWATISLGSPQSWLPIFLGVDIIHLMGKFGGKKWTNEPWTIEQQSLWEVLNVSYGLKNM